MVEGVGSQVTAEQKQQFAIAVREHQKDVANSIALLALGGLVLGILAPIMLSKLGNHIKNLPAYAEALIIAGAFTPLGVAAIAVPAHLKHREKVDNLLQRLNNENGDYGDIKQALQKLVPANVMSKLG